MDSLIGMTVLNSRHKSNIELLTVDFIEYGYRTAEISLKAENRIEKILVSRVDTKHPELHKMNNLFLLSESKPATSATLAYEIKNNKAAILVQIKNIKNAVNPMINGCPLTPFSVQINTLNGLVK